MIKMVKHIELLASNVNRFSLATRHIILEAGDIIIISIIAENRRVANLLYQNRFTIDTNNNFGKVK